MLVRDNVLKLVSYPQYKYEIIVSQLASKNVGSK